MDPIESTVKSYILQEFLPGTPADELASDTPLIDGGILDSLATVRLVAFLEEQFRIEVQAHEANVANLNSLEDITRFVRSKLAQSRDSGRG